MTTGRDRTVLWVAAAIGLALLCCLFLLLLATAVSVWLAVDGGDGQGPPPRSSTPGPTPSAPESSWEFQPVPAEAREMLERLQTSIVPISDPISLAERLQGRTGIPRVLATSAEPIPLGTVETFWALNTDTLESFQVEAALAYATDHVYFWIEQGVDYDPAELKALIDQFEAETYPKTRAFFGSEWSPGVDGDPHLYMLLANGLGSVAGYFSSGDEYSPLAHEYSNGHEMFYLMAAYIDLGSEWTAAVLAHEFQHMIHWNLDRNESTWMNEGFAEVAAHLNGFAVDGSDLEFALDPDQNLTNWPSDDSFGHYGQAFLVLAYFLDRFGAEATQALVADPENGFDSIDKILAELRVVDEADGETLTADEVFLDWAVALLLQDGTLADGRYGYTSYPHPPQPSYAETVAECPQTDQRRSVHQYGVDYIRILCPGRHRLTVSGTSLVPILPVGAHSGEFAFWSNRGDESDMTLTRAFDLRQVQGPAALDYWVWYEIEEEWDYAYLQVSEDGGATWSILTTPGGTDADPTGNSYGWGYTGFSGGGSSGAWVEERVDLSAYAGGEILIRFEYVTDAAVNGEGLLLDDVRLDAVGYAEDFEDGDGGWQAEGFVRYYRHLPQTYALALVERGAETRVTVLGLDADGSVEVPVDLGGEFDEAVLVVVGTTRHTWQPALYRFSVTPE